MTDTELQREQEYLKRLYARLDSLRQSAEEQLDAIRRLDVGGNHQSRSERDTFARMYEDRVSQLRQVNERLAFGRLELARSTAASDDTDGSDAEPRFRYIGRIGLRDENLAPLLLDWRVPQASAFYQATAKTPLGTRARRHLFSKGRQLIRIEDEIFDAELLDENRSRLQGEGALLASLSAQRTGRMHDIVETIQAEQDRIIRSPLAGVLVVQGGPGTGKTAVALHRAAFLLYAHRERLRSSGVLIVGPSPAFLRYIEAVLPSLGESGVVLTSVGRLYPQVTAVEEDAPAVAVIKGGLAMADLIARAVRSRQRVPRDPQQLNVSGDTVTLQPQLVMRAIARARQGGKPHNVARVTFVKTVLGELAQQWATQLRDHGNTVDESDLAMLREDLRSSYDVRVALNTAWLPLTPQKLLKDLYSRPRWLAELTPDWSAEQRALLARDRDAPFTVSDVALLDEAAQELGEYDIVASADKRRAKQQRGLDLANAKQAIENLELGGLINANDLADNFAEIGDRASTAEQAAADRTWIYGHVVVDEAQELSPMQWRLLRRRCPHRSFTVVGDIAQAASASAAGTWRDALHPLVGTWEEGDRWHLEELTVNYRTPSQIAAAAESMAIAHGLPVTASSSVRQSEWPITILPSAADAIRANERIDSLGTVAVIVSAEQVQPLAARLGEEFGESVSLGAQGLTTSISVLSPREAKGLEFDAVIVVDPWRIVEETPRGAAALYVAMTRTTQRLWLVEVDRLPAGLAVPLSAMAG